MKWSLKSAILCVAPVNSAEMANKRSRYDNDGSDLNALAEGVVNYYGKIKTQLTPAFFTRIKQSKVYTETIAETEM